MGWKLITFAVAMLMSVHAQAEPFPPTQRFLVACAGFQMKTDVDRAVGYASCLGRTRGFIEGHQTTVVLQHALARQTRGIPMPPLWCVDTKQTDSQVLHAVEAWVASNPSEFAEIESQYPTSSITIATATIVRAVSATYTCK